MQKLYICCATGDGNSFPIATIEYSEKTPATFDYWISPIQPNYNDAMANPVYYDFCGIAGIPDPVTFKSYHYKSLIPAFVRERTFPDRRYDLQEALAKYGMTQNDRMEFMRRTHGLCGVSSLFVTETANDTTFHCEYHDVKRRMYLASQTHISGSDSGG